MGRVDRIMPRIPRTRYCGTDVWCTSMSRYIFNNNLFEKVHDFSVAISPCLLVMPDFSNFYNFFSGNFDHRSDFLI